MPEGLDPNSGEGNLLNGLDVPRLQGIIAAVKANPALGRGLRRARTRWKSGFNVQVSMRDFSVDLDEPTDLGGTDNAPNPVEMILGAYGACLTVGYALNAALRGIEIQKLEIDLEGDIDLPGFLGLEIPGFDPPGFSTIRARVFLKSTAPLEELEKLSQQVAGTSPVGLTLARAVNLSVELAQRRIL